jgi:hypothetical protein
MVYELTSRIEDFMFMVPAVAALDKRRYVMSAVNFM